MAEELKNTQEPKTRSFRVTDDVLEGLKKVQSEMGLTQDKALQMLVNLYEIEGAKSSVPDRQTEIDQFQMHASALIQQFLNSVQLEQDAGERARADFAVQLKTMGEKITDLQKKLDDSNTSRDSYKELYSKANEKLAAAEKNRDDAIELKDKAEATIKDKEAIINSIAAELAEYKQKASDYDALEKELADANAATLDAKRDTELLERKFEDARQRAEQDLKDAKRDVQEALNQAKYQAEREKADAVSSAEAKGREQINALNEKLHKQELAAQSAVNDAVKKAEAASNEQIQQLIRENGRLTAELGFYKNLK